MAPSCRPITGETRLCMAPMSPTRKSCMAKLRFVGGRGDCGRNLPSPPPAVEVGGSIRSGSITCKNCGSAGLASDIRQLLTSLFDCVDDCVRRPPVVRFFGCGILVYKHR